MIEAPRAGAARNGFFVAAEGALVMDLIRGQKAQDLANAEVHAEARGQHIAKVLPVPSPNAERKAEDSGAPLDVDQLFVRSVL